MRLRYTRTAARQLGEVLTYIAEQNPSGARSVQRRIRVITELLQIHPFAGQATDRASFRRMVATPYPYVLTYRIGNGEIIIRSVRHAARRRLT